MKKKIFIAVGILILLGAIGGGIGLYLFNKPVKNFAESKVEMSLPAKAIFTDFVKDETSANAKYVAQDKTIQVSGKITEIKPNDDSTVGISLEVEDPDSALTCTVVKEDASKAQKYKVGDNIALKGQCTGMQELINKEVIMIGCGIIEK